MTNVGNFLTFSFLLDHVDHGRQVILSHLVPAEVPIFLLILVVVPGGVAETVSVASRVSKPDIVAGASSHKSRRYFCVIDDPTEGRVDDAVLEQNRRLCHAA